MITIILGGKAEDALRLCEKLKRPKPLAVLTSYGFTRFCRRVATATTLISSKDPISGNYTSNIADDNVSCHLPLAREVVHPSLEEEAERRFMTCVDMARGNYLSTEVYAINIEKKKLQATFEPRWPQGWPNISLIEEG